MEEKQPRVAQVCAALNRAKAKYLVIGGVACILHGYGRATEDIDILIERTRELTGQSAEERHLCRKHFRPENAPNQQADAPNNDD